MFCPNCGKEILKTAKFCPQCGYKIDTLVERKDIDDKPEKIDVGQTNKLPEVKQQPTDASLIKLQKLYKDTANSSIALSIFGFIATFFVSLAELTLAEALLGTIIMSPFLIPYFYFGQKLKKSGVENLEYSLKISKGMLIYTILFVIINMIAGGVGFLWLILLYYYYKSYKETKDFIGITK